MTKVVMIGIDGLDADLLRVYGPSLPHIRKMMLESPFLELTSSFPPETTLAWASLYTGLHPSNSSIMSKSMQALSVLQQTTSPTILPKHKCEKEVTFWEQASEAGKRVCILNPLMAYPACPVNGILVTLPPAHSKECASHFLSADDAHNESFPVVPSSLLRPKVHSLSAWCKSLHALTVQQAERGLELFQREPWDIFYQQFDTLEYVQHVLWRYSDPGDAAYPGRNKHAGRILDFYRLFDTIIGHFRALLEADDVLLVVSGHGHGRRCVYRFNLNEWLRQQELLVAYPRVRCLLHRRSMLDWTRYHAREFVARWLPTYGLSSGQRGHYSTHLIVQEETAAQVVPLADGGPFGGIVLNKVCVERAGYTCEAMRSMIVQRLGQLRVKGRPVVHWVDVRENVCQGKYSECYPDICFELQNDFAVGSAVYVALVTNEQVRSHSLVAGEHRMHGVCLLSHLPRTLSVRESIKEPSVMDIAPTVLQLIGVPCAARDGQALILPQDTMITT